MTSIRRVALGALVAVSLAAPALAQQNVTQADIQRLQDNVYLADRDVAQLRVRDATRANQLTSELKYEMALDLTAVRETAIGSSNYHEDHFGHAFGLHLADGTSAHSACIGFGLDRITLALFATHGMDLDQWPGEVRAALSC